MKRIFIFVASEEFASFIGGLTLTLGILVCALADGDTGKISDGALIDKWWIFALGGFFGMMINIHENTKKINF
ncbi:MAG: hypothetical protein ACKUBY_04260 [Candidatus Moraniibacteriota bacterium]|jgi:hypothetical protein